MKQRGFHDDEEKDLITAYESGEFRPVEDQQRAKQTAVQAARRYLRKDARVNIRLSSADLEMLKRRAAEEGLEAVAARYPKNQSVGEQAPLGDPSPRVICAAAITSGSMSAGPSSTQAPR